MRGLRVGGSSVDLLYERRKDRTKVSVIARRGVKISLIKKWKW